MMSARGMKAGISIDEMSLPAEAEASVAAAATTAFLLAGEYDDDERPLALCAAGADADIQEAALRRGARAEEAKAAMTGRDDEAAACTVECAASDGDRQARIVCFFFWLKQKGVGALFAVGWREKD